MGGQEEHLVFKSIGRERPSMTEDDGLTLAFCGFQVGVF